MDTPTPSGRSSAKRWDVSMPTFMDGADHQQVYFASASGSEDEQCLHISMRQDGSNR